MASRINIGVYRVDSIMTAKSDMQNRIIYLREGYTGLISL